MFWKYIFPVILCLLTAWFIRKFLCYVEHGSSKEERLPRLIVIIICLLAFAPIVNYIAFIATIFSALCIEEIQFREKPFKNEKLQKWLLKE